MSTTFNFSFCKQNVRMRSSSRTCACMHARLEGELDPPAQHAAERSQAKVPVTVTVLVGDSHDGQIDVCRLVAMVI